jgi:hypothetical protein
MLLQVLESWDSPLCGLQRCSFLPVVCGLEPAMESLSQFLFLKVSNDIH